MVKFALIYLLFFRILFPFRQNLDFDNNFSNYFHTFLTSLYYLIDLQILFQANRYQGIDQLLRT